MKKEKTITVTSSSGLGFASALTILFIGLKLAGFISWSWWWVLSPMLIGAGFVLAVLTFVVFVMSFVGITMLFKMLFKN